MSPAAVHGCASVIVRFPPGGEVLEVAQEVADAEAGARRFAGVRGADPLLGCSDASDEKQAEGRVRREMNTRLSVSAASCPPPPPPSLALLLSFLRLSFRFL